MKNISGKRKSSLIGKKFGELTVEYVFNVTTKSGKPNTMAHCICSCGKEVDVYSSHLYDGHTKSCGCLKHKASKRRIDLTGQVFGRLTVLEMLYNYKKDEYSYAKTCVRCKCACGKEIIASANSVKSGDVTSCGCYRRNVMRETHRHDLTGQRFGKLVVQEMIWGSRESGTRTLARCLCDCGNEKIVPASQLTMRQTSSCGCLGKSYGEHLIEEYLDSQNIKYKKQYTFDDCKYIGTLKFDFAILDENNNPKLLIEYDGMQHFKEVPYFGGKEGLNSTKARDEAKNRYCVDNKIPLLRLPYTLSDSEVKTKIMNAIYP